MARSPATPCGSALTNNEAELREIQAQFELHPLAIEDALYAHQPPKLELYHDSLFLVLRTAQLQGDHVAFGDPHLRRPGLRHLDPPRALGVLGAGAYPL